MASRARWCDTGAVILELPPKKLDAYTTRDPVLQLGFLIGDLIEILEHTRDLPTVAARLRAMGWTKL